MGKLLIPLVLGAIVFGGYRVAYLQCQRAPGRRAWIIATSIASLVSAAALVPWLLAKLDPPYSESPAGIFIYLGKAVVVGVLLLGGLGALIGSVMAGRAAERPPE